MLSLTHAGITYRTKALLPVAAERFAKCLAANPLFTAVHVEPAKNPAKSFVAFQPVSEQRQAAMFDTVQAQREERAAAEGDGYTWCLDKDGGRPFFWCLSLSGEVYEVSEHTCTCPDHTYRCAKAGLKCKHQLALLQGRGTVSRF